MKLACKKSNQQIDFYIPTDCKNVAVNCSGGADSSILLLMTMDYIIKNNMTDTKVSVLTCSNHKKGRWNGRKAAKAIEYAIRKTGFRNFDMHYIYYRDVQDSKYFMEVERKLFKEKRMDLLISGITSNPPLGSSVENIHGEDVCLDDGRVSDRDGASHPEWQTYGLFRKIKFYDPFINVDKRFVAEMYRQYDANDLFHSTRSCEAKPTIYSTEFENEPCGECWWCLERKWAFGEF